MDTVTQIVLGTAIAEGWFRRELGRKSLIFGAFCGWFPDSDVLLHSFGTWESMVSHRAETHSLLCLPFFALPLAWAGHRWGSKGRCLGGTSWPFGSSLLSMHSPLAHSFFAILRCTVPGMGWGHNLTTLPLIYVGGRPFETGGSGAITEDGPLGALRHNGLPHLDWAVSMGHSALDSSI